MKRILIKLSGEQFGGEAGKGIDTDVIQILAKDIKKSLDKHNCEIAVVVGGGNFIRGTELHKNENLILESTAHYMGMLATIMNSMALNDILESVGQTCRVLLKVEASKISEGFTRLRAIEHMKKGRVVIFGTAARTFATTAGAKTITLSTGSMLQDGYIVGDTVLVNGMLADCNGIYVISTLSATVLTFLGPAATLTYTSGANTISWVHTGQRPTFTTTATITLAWTAATKTL
jgi:hypothetical protein